MLAFEDFRTPPAVRDRSTPPSSCTALSLFPPVLLCFLDLFNHTRVICVARVFFFAFPPPRARAPGVLPPRVK